MQQRVVTLSTEQSSMSCEAQQVSLREREQHYQLVTGRPYLVYCCPLLFPVSCDSSLIEVLFLASRDYYPHVLTEVTAASCHFSLSPLVYADHSNLLSETTLVSLLTW